MTAAVAAPAPLRAKALVGLSMLAWTQGDGLRAATALATALSLIDEKNDLHVLAFARLAEAYLALSQGDFARVQARATDSKARYAHLGRRWDQLSADFCLAWAVFGQGDLPRAETLYAEVIAGTACIGDDYGLATARFGLGLLYATKGDNVRALVLQASALTGFQALLERMWLPACLEATATVVSPLGQMEPATRLLGLAKTIRKQNGLPTWFADRAISEETTAAARAVLGEAAFSQAWAAGAAATLAETVAMVAAMAQAFEPAHLPGDDPADPVGLSPREVDVLRLLAEGRTDREIGSTLSVSRRTVHTHVASILNKFGVENRAAAAAQAVRLGLV